MKIQFGEWGPDAADHDSDLATVAHNVLPAARSYRPLQSFAAATPALAATCIGATYFRRTVGTVRNIAATQTKFYELSSGAWVDVTRASGGNYTAGAEDFWQFEQYGTLGIATNFRDAVQKLDVEAVAGTKFTALGGSPPKARYVTTVGDQLVLGYLDTDRPNGIHFSGLNDSEGWTPGVNSSDTQLFPYGGHVMGLAGGSVGYVFQQDAIRRMLPRPGSAEIFQFDVIEPDHGLRAPRSLVQIGRRIFYLSQTGFFMFTGEGSQPIGAERVDRTFYSRLDSSRIDKVIGAADPVNQLVVWVYPSKTAPNGQPDQAIIYNWAINRWTEATISGSLIVPLVSESINLDSMPSYGYTNLDTLPFSLDAAFWRGGNLYLGLIGTDNKLAVPSGLPMAATIETGEMQLGGTGRALVTGATPQIDASGTTVAVATRERRSATEDWSDPATMEDTGECTMHQSGRFHRFRMATPAGASWTHTTGIDVTASQDGAR